MENKKTNHDAIKDDLELLKKKESLFESAKKYRSQFEKKWEEYERFYNGEQWAQGQRRPVKNFLYAIIEQEVAILTETRPGTDVIPLERQHEDGAQVLHAAISSVYDSQRFNIKLAQAVREALVPGPSWIMVDYDHDCENGQGNCIIKNLHWKHVWLDPAANEIDEAEFAFIKLPLPIEVARRLYPDQKEKIKPINVSDSTQKAGDGRNPDIHRPYDSVNQEVSRYDSDAITELEEFWFKDYSMVKVPEEETIAEIEKEKEEFLSGINPDVGKFEDHDTHLVAHQSFLKQLASELLMVGSQDITDQDVMGLEQDETFALIKLIVEDHLRMHEILKEKNPKGLRPKYPSFWRRTVWSCKSKLIDESPEVQDGMLPLVPVYAQKVLNSIYGEGDVKNIIHCQKSYNDMDYAEYKALRLNSNGGWILDNNSGVDKTTLDNREGIVIEKNQGTEVTRIPAGTVSPQYQMRKANDKVTMEEISGVNEITQGRKPAGVTAGTAIQQLRDSSITRIRQKSRNIEEYTMLRIGQLIASRVIKYWSVERKLRVYDKDGTLQYVQFDPEKVQDIKYNIKISSGTTAGVDKESIFALMKDLLLNQLIDRNTFFKIVDVPYKAEIIKDIQEQEEVAAQNNEVAVAAEQLGQENEQLKAQLMQVEQMLQQGGINTDQPPLA